MSDRDASFCRREAGILIPRPSLHSGRRTPLFRGNELDDENDYEGPWRGSTGAELAVYHSALSQRLRALSGNQEFPRTTAFARLLTGKAHSAPNRSPVADSGTGKLRQIQFFCVYVEENPVRADLVKSPSDWAWSSAHPQYHRYLVRPWPWSF